MCLNDHAEALWNKNDNCVFYYSVLMDTKRPFMAHLSINLCILIFFQLKNRMKINPITSTCCKKMTGSGVHHVEHSKKSRDPSFEHLQIYDRETCSEHIRRDDRVTQQRGKLMLSKNPPNYFKYERKYHLYYQLCI